MRGRKHGMSPLFLLVYESSDTLIPVRGRKLHFTFGILSLLVKFRYLNPREGTETPFFIYIQKRKSVFRYLNPREGTETDRLSFGHKTLDMFRYLNPREGTETLSSHSFSFLQRYVQIP